MDTIECGKLIDSLKQLTGNVSKALNKLVNFGIKLSDAKNDEEHEISTVTGTLRDGTKLDITWQPHDETKKMFRMKIKDTRGKSVEDANVREGDYDKRLMELVKEGWGVDISDTPKDTAEEPQQAAEESKESAEEPKASSDLNAENDKSVSESTKLHLRLHKVCGSKEDSIVLDRIYGNYAISDMNADLDVLLNDDNFAQSITEAGNDICVTVTPNEFDVQTCSVDDVVCCRESILDLLKCAYLTLWDLQDIHWNVRGDDFDTIHELSDKYIHYVFDDIDWLAELCVELTDNVPHVHDLLPCPDSVSVGTDYWARLKDTLNNFATALESYSCNFSPDTAEYILERVRLYRKSANFFVGRALS